MLISGKLTALKSVQLIVLDLVRILLGFIENLPRRGSISWSILDRLFTEEGRFAGRFSDETYAEAIENLSSGWLNSGQFVGVIFLSSEAAGFCWHEVIVQIHDLVS